jgi:integrase/recombinase XerD
MLSIYRRHQKHCPHRCEGRKHLRCGCPLWVDGRFKSKRLHKALGTSDWQKAQQIVREWEAAGSEPTTIKRRTATLEESWRLFLADLDARNLHSSTRRKYKLLAREMGAFAVQEKCPLLEGFDLVALTEFRSTWKMSPLTSLKKLERLRAFFSFCQDHGWIDTNPARKIRLPKVPHRPTLPFTQQEVEKTLAAVGPYVDQTLERGKDNARRLRLLVLLLRYTGMRIGDVVKLTTNRFKYNKLLLYTQKTGVPVYSVLPDFVASALASTQTINGAQLFWDGTGNLETIIGSWQRRLRKLFRLAQIENGHAHRFRDTFASELLLAGVPLERVSILLGHQSVKITEKYYAAWTDSRQRQVEADLERAWRSDPIVLMESKVTRRLRGENEIVN